MKNTNTLSKDRLKKIVMNYAIYLILLIVVGVIVAVDPSFLQIGNLSYICTQASTRLILSLGVAGIIVLGGRTHGGHGGRNLRFSFAGGGVQHQSVSEYAAASHFSAHAFGGGAVRDILFCPWTDCGKIEGGALYRFPGNPAGGVWAVFNLFPGAGQRIADRKL